MKPVIGSLLQAEPLKDAFTINNIAEGAAGPRKFVQLLKVPE
jgi:hypothetical protein